MNDTDWIIYGLIINELMILTEWTSNEYIFKWINEFLSGQRLNEQINPWTYYFLKNEWTKPTNQMNQTN